MYINHALRAHQRDQLRSQGSSAQLLRAARRKVAPAIVVMTTAGLLTPLPTFVAHTDRAHTSRTSPISRWP